MNGEHRPRVPGLVVVLVALLAAAAAFVAAAWLADRATTDADEATPVAPAIADPVIVPGPLTAAAEATDGGEGTSTTDRAVTPAAEVDPGAIVALGDAPPSLEGIPGGAWLLPVDLVADDGDAPSAARPELPDGTEPTATTVPPVPADQAAPTAEQLGAVSVQPPAPIVHFIDLCATGGSPCPLGVPTTVVPLAGDTKPPKVEIKVWPGMTRALQPTLRCDPGYPTAASIPVVVTANQPLSSAALSLELPDGRPLSTTSATTSAAELAWFAQRQGAGQPVGTDLATGVQYCASLATLGDPFVAAATSGVTLPSPLVYRLDVRGYTETDVAVAIVDVPGDLASSPGPRPKTIVQPLTGNVAQIVVSETEGVRPTVWVANSFYWKDKVGLGTAAAYCAQAPPGAPDPGYYDPPAPVLVPQRQSYDPGQLGQATYPYSRDYKYYRVWDAVLREGSTYALCISWPLPTGEEREAWTLDTPNGLEFTFTNANLAEHGDTPYQDWYLRARETNCTMTWPDPTAPGGSPSGYLCPSRGLPYPPVLTFDHTGTYPTPYTGAGTVTDDLGTTRVRTPTWCTDVFADVTAGDVLQSATKPGSSLLYQCAWGSNDIPTVSWTVPFVFADQNVLCGDDDCLAEHRRATATARAAVGEGAVNSRSRLPTDWGIQGPAAA